MKPSNRKILFFDVDGTLIDDKTKIVPESAKEALKKARENGHLVFINSGRVSCMTKSVRERFSIDGLICGCGTEIIIDGRTVFETRLDKARCQALIADIRKYQMDAILEAQEASYMEMPFHTVGGQKLYEATKKYTILDRFDDSDLIFDKFCIVGDRSLQGEALEEYNRRRDAFLDTLSDFEIIDRGHTFFELVPKSHSKGSGLEYVLKHYGISKEDAFVFGDSTNDISMFQSGVAHRIIMGEHDAALLPFASFKTKTVLEDGIEYAMKHFNLI